MTKEPYELKLNWNNLNKSILTIYLLNKTIKQNTLNTVYLFCYVCIGREMAISICVIDDHYSLRL